MKGWAASLTASLLALAGCAGADPEIAGSPADPEAPAATAAPMTGVLAPGFDPNSLAVGASATAAPHVHGATFACPHHPTATATTPGKCPVCGMALEPVKEAPPAASHGAGEGHR